MPPPTRTWTLVPETREAGLLDTSVVIDLGHLDTALLPQRAAICAVTLAELSAGPAATEDPAERARRQDRLQRVEATFEPIALGAEAARAYGRVYAAVVAAGRQPRRFADLMIASVAIAEDLPLYTRNPNDFAGLESLLDVMAL